MFRLKSYLTGLICLLLFVGVFFSRPPPVQAVETCTGAPTWNECYYDSDCGSPHTCSCISSWEYCTITASTPIPTRTPTPRPTATPYPCERNGYWCEVDEGPDTCSLYGECEKNYSCGANRVCCGPCAATNTPTPTRTPTPTLAPPTPTPTPFSSYCSSDGHCSLACAGNDYVCVPGNFAGIDYCNQNIWPTPTCAPSNNARVYDTCNYTAGGIAADCGKLNTVTYCGYNNACIANSSCNAVDNPGNCTAINNYSPAECASGMCSLLCGYMRTQIVCCNQAFGGAVYSGCPQTGINPMKYHCGDTCTDYSSGICAGIGICVAPTATPPGGGPTSTPGGPTNTPTPSPTIPPAVPGPWIKLKNSSFISVNNLTNNIPLVPVIYDTDDDATANFIISEAGVVGAAAINITGLNTNAKTGSPEYKALYSPNPYSLTPNSYLSYINARKQHKSITDLSGIEGDGIYIYKGTSPLEINAPLSAVFDNNIVLVTTGVININTNLSPGGSNAFLASQINFDSTVTEASGIFIANDVTTGTTANQGLKIIGNLVAQTSLTNGREWSDLNIPSLFIVFDSQKYIDLLPYLSTASYEWRQVQ